MPSTDHSSEQMNRFLKYLMVAVAAVIPALFLRIAGGRMSPLADTAIFGIAILAAGFLLSWGAEAAEKRVSQGLVLAGVALVTVLPEYAVDLYYAFRAGQQPASDYVHYAAANMTGANRLLVGFAWPLMVLLNAWQTREEAISLREANLVEIGFLMLSSLYAFVILWKNQINAIDFVVLASIFGAYLWRISRKPLPTSESSDDADDEDDEPGPAAALGTLGVKAQWIWMTGLTLVAALVILSSAERFAESIVASGRLLGISEFLLIQWLAPLASEAPTVAIAVLFVLAGRASAGLVAMISDKINQWTLLVGMLPIAVSVGAMTLASLPLDARQHEEFFLTAAQSLFGVSLLLRLRLGLWAAVALAVLFGAQVVVALVLRDHEAAVIRSLTALGWLYIVLAALVSLTSVPDLVARLRRARAVIAQ